MSSQRVQQLEAELLEVREAFEDYIKSSKELEDGLDQELREMRQKLESSTSSNEVLASQLEKMEPMLTSLESSLANSKEKLKEESRLRKQAELAQVEMEARFGEGETNVAALRRENIELREECEALHEELEFKCREIDNYKKEESNSRRKWEKLGNRLESRLDRRDSNQRDYSTHTAVAIQDSDTNGSSTNRAESTVDDSYAEVLDELEGVTEQLITTQQKLWSAEDKLRETQARNRVLESSQRRNSTSARNVSLFDSMLDDSTTEPTVKHADNKLAAELNAVKSQLAAAEGKAGLSTNETYFEDLRQQIDILRDQLQVAQLDVELYQSEADEIKDENATLVEEVACLRGLLGDGHSVGGTTWEEIRENAKSEANKKREKDLNVLRGKLKKIVKENASLKSKLENFENGMPTSFARKGEVSNLKKEISRLQLALRAEKDNVHRAVKDSEDLWLAKLEAVKDDVSGERELLVAQVRGEMMEERSEALRKLYERIDAISNEKSDVERKVEQLEMDIVRSKKDNMKFADQAVAAAENLKAARDEILALKKKTGTLSSDLEHTQNSLSRAQVDAQEIRVHYSDVCAQLEVAKQILDENGLEGETIARENETELKRQIHSLSKSLEQSRQEYADLENEFLDNQHRFCDSQEEASRKSEDEIQYLTRKITQMEEALEEARADHSEISVKLEQAKKDCSQAVDQGKYERKGREEAERALEAQKETLEASGARFSESGELRNEEVPAELLELKEELLDCKNELQAMRLENSKLKQEMIDFERTGMKGIKILDKFFGSNKNTRNAPDPDPVEDGEGVEVVRASTPTDEIMKSLDPPMSRRDILGGIGGFESVQSDLVQLRSNLLDVTLENENLKDQLLKTSMPTMRNADVQKTITALEEALKKTEYTAEELEIVAQKLIVSETKLAAAHEALQSSEGENRALRTEVLSLKDSVRRARDELLEVKARQGDVKREFEQKSKESLNKVRSHFLGERGDEFNELRDQFKKMTEEKAILQHQLDDSKIALSVSQYAQERNKDELRASESKLSVSVDEVFKLKNELSKAKRSIAETKQAHAEIADELDRKIESTADPESSKAVTTLSRQLKQLSEENTALQQMVGELEDALDLAQTEIETKSYQVNALNDNLLSSQEETRLLTEEISHLSTAFETAKEDYNAVVDELEAVNDLFEESRREAELIGKEAAMEEIRAEMQDSRDKERQAMKEKVRKLFEENAALERKLNEAESDLAEEIKKRSNEREAAVLQKEVEMLKSRLSETSDEIKMLKEKELDLSVELRESQNELKEAKEELELAGNSAKREKDNVVSNLKKQRSSENEEYQALRDHLRKLVDEHSSSELKSASIDSQHSHEQKSDELKLKVDLLDMSFSLEKLMKDNALIEEELERVRGGLDLARKEGEQEGRINASKAIRKEMKRERDTEMREFKEKFNELVEENSTLGQKLRDAEIQLSLTMDDKQQGSSEMSKLQKELKNAKAESKKFQQEVFNLTVELESANEDHEEVVHEIKASFKADRDAKVKGIQNQLNALIIENTTLQQKLRSAETKLETSLKSEERIRSEMEMMVETLQESQVIIRDLEDQVSDLKSDLRTFKSNKNGISSEKTLLETKLQEAEETLELLRSSTEGNVDDLRSSLRLTKEENMKLKLEASQLRQTLEESSQHLDLLREQFDRVSSETSARDNSEAGVLRSQLKKLAEEKAALQKDVDEARITLSLQKYSQDKNVEELKIYQEELQSSKEESNETRVDLSKVHTELAKTKQEFEEAMTVMREINQILDSVEGVPVTTSEGYGNFSVRTQETKVKVLSITSMLHKAKKDHELLKNETTKTHAESQIVDKRVAASEATLEKVRQSQLKDKLDLELCELKLAESKKEAEGYKSDIQRLKTALEFAQRDHTSLRQQLEHMNVRVAQMCVEAEARGKAVAAQELRAGVVNVDEKDRRELMAQFKRFYEENLALQGKLDEMEAELAVARDTEDKHKAAMKQMKREAKETSAKAGKLEFANKRLNEELDVLREDLDNAKVNRTEVVRELGMVKERLSEITAMKASDSAAGVSESVTTKSHRDAEISLLQEQFKKLSKKSVTLGQKVVDAEDAVEKMRRQHERTREQAEERSRKTEKLNSIMDKAIGESSKLEEEMGDISIAMGNRVSMAEENVNRLERDISVAKGKLQVTEAGLFALRMQRGRNNRPPRRSQSQQRESGTTDEDSSIVSSSEQTNSESREDVNAQNSKRPKHTSSPATKQFTAPKETSLTSRALEVIAQSKKKSNLRKFDIRADPKNLEGSNAPPGKQSTIKGSGPRTVISDGGRE